MPREGFEPPDPPLRSFETCAPGFKLTSGEEGAGVSAVKVNELADTLRRLDDVLRQKAPGVSAALRPGIPESKVRRLLETFPHPVSDDVIALYSWHDGAEGVGGALDRAELFHNAQMLPLQEALRTRAEAMSADSAQGVTVWQSHWLPLFTGYKFAFWVAACDRPRPPLIVFDFVDLPDFWIAYENVASMVARVLRCWTKDAYREGAHATVDVDKRAVAQVNREMDTGPTDVEALVAGLASAGDRRYGDSIAWLRTRLYPEAVPALIRLLENESRGRYAAIELLGSIGGSAALDKLYDVAQNDEDKTACDLARHAIETSDPC